MPDNDRSNMRPAVQARPSSSLQDVLSAISALAASNNLAAVLIQMNDTYLIEERLDSGVPGMARVAGLTREIRNAVRDLLGEDRTLVMHSGDYLSPSAMSRIFRGEQMVDLLNVCQVDFATLGNHEFDFSANVLQTRLIQGQFKSVVANLTPPAGDPYALTGIAFWPEQQPFLAITGIAGSQTAEKARRFGFSTADLPDTIAKLLGEIRARPEIGGLVVLSHMDRHEDKRLQELLSQRWHKSGFVYILGGHEHDVVWRERDWRHCLLSKCLSNCKSITVFLVRKDGLAAPAPNLPHTLAKQPDKEGLLKISEFLDAGNELQDLSPIKDREGLLEEIVPEARKIAPPGTRTDFQAAFEETLREAVADFGLVGLREDQVGGVLSWFMVSAAIDYATDAFYRSAYEISAREHIASLPIFPPAEESVRAWVAKTPTIGSEGVLVDFSDSIALSNVGMDATDKSLRWHSTDFGNFAADAIKVALDADLCLINAGSFRLDGFVGKRVRERDLRDVFIYDRNDAVLVIPLSAGEIGEFYKHAVQRAGQGGFLQVSDSLPDVTQRSGLLRVALITHMLEDNEDGYQALLSAMRNVGSHDLTAAARNLPHGSIVDLISAAASRVRYSHDRRISAQQEVQPMDRAVMDFVSLVDSYREACQTAGIELDASLALLATDRNDVEGKVPSAVWQAGKALHSFVLPIWGAAERDPLTVESFIEHLAHSPSLWRGQIPYDLFFNRACDGVYNGGWDEEAWRALYEKLTKSRDDSPGT